MKMRLSVGARQVLLVALLIAAVVVEAAIAQSEFPAFGFSLPGGLSGAAPITLEASYELEEATSDGKLAGHLIVTADIEPGFHVYAVDQPKGGPMPTKIRLLSKFAELAGDIIAEPAAKVAEEAFGADTIEVRKHLGRVAWKCPITVTPSPNLAQAKIAVRVSGQVCSSSCIPFDEELSAKLIGGMPPVAPSAPAFRHENGHVEWYVSVRPARLKPGSSAALVIRAVPDEGYHVYPVQIGDKSTNFRTIIVISEKSGFQFGAPSPSSNPIEQVLVPDDPPILIHEGEVTWTIPVFAPQSSVEGSVSVEGLIGYQACNEGSCDAPAGIKFRVALDVGNDLSTGVAVAALDSIPFKSIVNAPARMTWVDQQVAEAPAAAIPQGPLDGMVLKNAPPSGEMASSSNASQPVEKSVIGVAEPMNWARLLSAFCIAIVAGFILNFMPCVLPVIGLKIAGFVQEGSGNPSRTRFLMMAYVAGIFASLMSFCVFLVIARDSFQANYLWGEHFTYFGFRVGMTVLLFAMALSFLGVWEIPIPGFASGQTSANLMSKQGGSGAFFKGVFSTILATPCSGPFLGPVIAGALTQPAPITITLFAGISFGMALPYVTVAMFPSTIGWLPKPGPWMDTFKQLLAFPLLFTTVFFVSQFSHGYRIAALTMLIGVWFACWLIGRVPAWSELPKKLTVWATATIVAVAVGWWSFRYLGNDEKRANEVATQHSSALIAWQPYSEELLQSLLAEGKTVMIDFTAAWCANCQTNLITAIETNRVSELLKRNEVVALVADWTDQSPEIKQKLIELKSYSIPVLAIYPASSPKEPIILRDSLLERQVLAALEQAGPSLPVQGSGGAASGRPRFSSTTQSSSENF